MLGLGKLGEVAPLPEPHRHLLVRALQVLAHLLCLQLCLPIHSAQHVLETVIDTVYIIEVGVLHRNRFS